jgi:hypothetical protein
MCLLRYIANMLLICCRKIARLMFLAHGRRTLLLMDITMLLRNLLMPTRTIVSGHTSSSQNTGRESFLGPRMGPLVGLLGERVVLLLLNAPSRLR